jgi:hypothetical protein
LEESSHQSGIEIGTDLNDLVALESANPTVPVVKPQTVFGGSQGMQFNDGPVSTRQRMLHVKLRALR